MDAGALRHRITIQTPASVQGPDGYPAPSWAKVTDTWASIRYPSGSQILKADAPISVVRALITIRYRDDVRADMRIVKGSKVFDIRAALPDETDARYLNLDCEVGANDG